LIDRLVGCIQDRYTVTWRACRYLIDLSGKQLVFNNIWSRGGRRSFVN